MAGHVRAPVAEQREPTGSPNKGASTGQDARGTERQCGSVVTRAMLLWQLGQVSAHCGSMRISSTPHRYPSTHNSFSTTSGEE